MVFSSTLRHSTGAAKLSLALAAGLWGLYWIPLRAMDESGITGAWATLMFLVIPAILLTPLYFLRWRRLLAGGKSLLITSVATALSLVLYSNSLIFTEIVHAILLFYLTPIWSTLLARVVLGERITPVRLVSIVLGLTGMAVILGFEHGLPIPRRLGDWMALLAGICWAVTAVRLRLDEKNQAEDHTLAYFLIGTVVALAFTFLPDGHTGSAPAMSIIFDVLPWLLPVIILLVMTSTYLVLWGARMVEPGLVAILFLTEISSGTVTAAIFADEPFGAREIVGVILISSAGLLEVIAPKFRRTN